MGLSAGIILLIVILVVGGSLLLVWSVVAWRRSVSRQQRLARHVNLMEVHTNVTIQQPTAARPINPPHDVISQALQPDSEPKPATPPPLSPRTLTNLGETGICKICCERERTVILLPCKHCICCVYCTEVLQWRKQAKCPLCRTPFTSFVKLRPSAGEGESDDGEGGNHNNAGNIAKTGSFVGAEGLSNRYMTFRCSVSTLRGDGSSAAGSSSTASIPVAESLNQSLGPQSLSQGRVTSTTTIVPGLPWIVPSPRAATAEPEAAAAVTDAAPAAAIESYAGLENARRVSFYELPPNSGPPTPTPSQSGSVRNARQY